MPYDPTIDRSIPQATPEGELIPTPPTLDQQRWELLLKDPSFIERLVGAGETAAMVGTSPIGYLAGMLGSGYGSLTGQDPRETGAKWEQASMYQPQTAVGQYYGEQVGDKLSSLPPVISGIPHLSMGPKAGRFAAETYAKPVAEMTADLYMSGQVPGMASPASYVVDPSKRRFLGIGTKDKTPEIDISPKLDMPLTVYRGGNGTLESIAKAVLEKPMTRRELFETAGNAAISHAGRGILSSAAENLATKPVAEIAKSVAKEPGFYRDVDIIGNYDLYKNIDYYRSKDAIPYFSAFPEVWKDSIKPTIHELLPTISKDEVSTIQKYVDQMQSKGISTSEKTHAYEQIHDILEKHHDPMEGSPIGAAVHKIRFKNSEPAAILDDFHDMLEEAGIRDTLGLENADMARYLRDRKILSEKQLKELDKYIKEDNENGGWGF